MGLTKSGASGIYTAILQNKYVGLLKAAPTSEIEYIEPSADEYERVTLSDVLNAPTPISGGTDGYLVDNSRIIYFPEAITQDGWGLITHFGIFSNKTGVGTPTSPTLLVWGTLSGGGVSVPQNTVPLFRPNQLMVTLQSTNSAAQ